MQDKLKSLLSVKSGPLKLLLLSSLVVLIFGSFAKRENKTAVTPSPVPTQTIISSPTPSSTPKPLTFAEMNAAYGPCTYLPTVMYHHIQSREQATVRKQTNLTVYTDVFKNQMQYLKDKGYITVSMSDLASFFDSGVPVARKSILLTFDDAYEDFYTDAYPILLSFGFSATVFTPTGLVNNPGYLTWDQISVMKGSILFANHTWSHKNVVSKSSDMQREISTADLQLGERGLNSTKVFAYPYGPDSLPAEDYLKSLGYKAAFTTKAGSILCAKKRFDLPRVRIGNSTLSSYGF